MGGGWDELKAGVRPLLASPTTVQKAASAATASRRIGLVGQNELRSKL